MSDAKTTHATAATESHRTDSDDLVPFDLVRQSNGFGINSLANNLATTKPWRDLVSTERHRATIAAAPGIRIRRANREDIPAIVTISNSSVSPEEDVGFGTPQSESPFTDAGRLSAAWKDPNLVRGAEARKLRKRCSNSL